MFRRRHPMKKLKLVLEKLRVETFEVGTSPAPRGTVHGRASSAYIACQFECFSKTCETQINCPSHDALCSYADTCTCYTAWTCEDTCSY
jgi:hypothetical protein